MQKEYIPSDSIYVKLQERQIYTNLWLPELTRKRHKGSFGLDGNLLYLDCGGGCMGVYICQNLGTVYLNGYILS